MDPELIKEVERAFCNTVTSNPNIQLAASIVVASMNLKDGMFRLAQALEERNSHDSQKGN